MSDTMTPASEVERLIIPHKGRTETLIRAADYDRVSAALRDAQQKLDARDRDWILAMAAALGSNGHYRVPIIPEPKPFKELFAQIATSRAAKLEAALREARSFVVICAEYQYLKSLSSLRAIDAALQEKASG